MSRHLTMLFVLLLVLAGSLFFFFQSDPEHQVRVSPDGFFRVEARDLSGGATFTIEQENGSASTARVSPLYTILPQGATGDIGYRVDLTSPLGASGFALAFLNEDHAWETVPTEWRQDRFMATGSAFRWALLQTQSVELPLRSEARMGELFNMHPDRAKAGVITTSYALEVDDYVLVPSTRRLVGCLGGGGQVNGVPEVVDRVDAVSFSINGVIKEGWVRTRATWFLDEQGCPLDRPLTFDL